MSDVQNPGSALGEAIGHLMERALSNYLEPIVTDYSCRMITTGPINRRTQKYTKLLLTDAYGTEYSIDGVIINEHNQPLILLESKYIRYKKHNRDKGSWICHAHNGIRSHYNSIRSSIAVLAGSWSKTSQRMIRSQNINIFYVEFDEIASILDKYNINFRWGEKDRHIAVEAWEIFERLSDDEKLKIGFDIIESIKPALSQLIHDTLSDETPRAVSKVIVEIHTNLGEVKVFEFETVDEALDFLEDFSFDEIMNHIDSFDIFHKPVIEDD